MKGERLAAIRGRHAVVLYAVDLLISTLSAGRTANRSQGCAAEPPRRSRPSKGLDLLAGFCPTSIKTVPLNGKYTRSIAARGSWSTLPRRSSTCLRCGRSVATSSAVSDARRRFSPLRGTHFE